jgi:hypothetical protein
VLRSSVPLQQVNKLEITPDKQYLAAAGNPHIRLFDVNSSHPHPVCILSVWFPVLYSSSAHMELLLLLCIYMCKPCWDLTAIDISNNTVYNPNTPRAFWAAILTHCHDPQLWTLNPILLCGSTTLWNAMFCNYVLLVLCLAMKSKALSQMPVFCHCVLLVLLCSGMKSFACRCV